MVVSIVSCRLPNPMAVASPSADVESIQAEQAGRPFEQRRGQLADKAEHGRLVGRVGVDDQRPLPLPSRSSVRPRVS
jgi:hypothetical protein